MYFIYSFDHGTQFRIGKLSGSNRCDLNGIHCDLNGGELSSMCNWKGCTYHDDIEDAEAELEAINSNIALAEHEAYLASIILFDPNPVGVDYLDEDTNKIVYSSDSY